jgi:hypothetical protein
VIALHIVQNYYTLKEPERGMKALAMNGLKQDLWVDADFSGLCNAEDAQDPASVRSRSHFVVTLGGVLVLWESKLMTEIILSMKEAEYCSVCMAMKQFLPLR